MRYTTALYDLDGTLLDFKTSEKQGFFEALEKHSIPCNQAMYERYSKINDELWKAFERGEISKEAIGCRRYAILFDEYQIDGDFVSVGNMYKAILATKGIVYGGAIEHLQRLKSKGVQLYAVTNGTAHIQHSRLAVSELDKLFLRTFVSEETGYQKPEREYFDFVFANIPEKDKSKILIIGDSPSSDIKGGINAGIDTCFFSSQPNANIRPTYITDSYEEIEKIIL